MSSPNTPLLYYQYILLCLTPDFTHQGESATTQWVNEIRTFS